VVSATQSGDTIRMELKSRRLALFLNDEDIDEISDIHGSAFSCSV
jgi:hypothetical protein